MKPLVANRIIFLLSILGLFVAGTLTAAHLGYMPLPCSRNAALSCETVNSHWSSSGLGLPFLRAIPTAAFGLLAYLLFAALCVVRLGASERAAERAALLQFALACVSLLITGWLTYLEANVIHAWCQWCLASAALICLIFLTALSERLLRRSARPGEAA